MNRGRGRGRRPKLPAERWLFSHPSWMNWWVLPNFEANPELRDLITGVFCVVVEANREELLPEIRRRSEALGWSFAVGFRHSHKAGKIDNDFDPGWHRRMVERLNREEGPDVCLDGENYFEDTKETPRFHGTHQYDRLLVGARPWGDLSPRARLFYYPAHPRVWAGRALMGQAARSGAIVSPLVYDTYGVRSQGNRLEGVMEQNEKLFGPEYLPGFYLEYLRNPSVMRLASRYKGCWFFPRTGDGHPDDLPKFGTPEWGPQ